MEVSEAEVMKPDYNDKVVLKRTSLSLSSDTYLLEKARKLLRGNNRESSPSCSINSPLWNTRQELMVESSISPENGLERQSQLRVQLSSGSSEHQDLLLQRTLSSKEKAFLILKDYQDLGDVSKKGKTQPTWTEQVKGGLEGPADDGHNWRKYGQKDILGAKYPRGYYRCAYRNVRNCWATKQIQRSDDDPTVFEITYKGTHVCNPATNNSVPTPPSPEKQELKHSYNHNNHQPQQPNQILMNFRANVRVNTGYSENKEIVSPFSFPSTSNNMEGESHSQIFSMPTLVDDNILGTYSPSFVSPATSGSNSFSISPCQMVNLGRAQNLHSSDVSTTASATNSPNGCWDF